MRNMKIITLFLILLFVSDLPTVAFSADYPNKPIRMIIPYPAGGGYDLVIRGMQKRFEEELGTRIIIENIVGGNSKLGIMEVVKAKPDGYTLLMGGAETMIGIYYGGGFGDLRIWEHLSDIANITREAWGFVEVRAESPYKTWADFVKAAKQNPGKLTCGSSSSRGMMEALWIGLTKASGIETKFVPFGGSGKSINAMLGGHVDARICTASEAMNTVRGGKGRGLAVSSDVRLPSLPDVQTFREAGFDRTVWVKRGILAPPNMPIRIVDILNSKIQKVVKDPEFIDLIENKLSYNVYYRSPSEQREDAKKFEELWKPLLTEMFR